MGHSHITEQPVKLNLGCGKKSLPDYINIDKFNLPGVNKVINLFTFPWDLPDNYADEFLISHLVEHIPHETKAIYDLETALLKARVFDKNVQYDENILRRWRELENLDANFAFFAEVWRIAKPNAVVKIVAPYGYSQGAFQDPTHTRYLVPSSFIYLTEETIGKDNKNFDYHLPFLFTIEHATVNVVDEELKRLVMEAKPEEVEALQKHSESMARRYWNIGDDMFIDLRVIK